MGESIPLPGNFWILGVLKQGFGALHIVVNININSSSQYYTIAVQGVGGDRFC